MRAVSCICALCILFCGLCVHTACARPVTVLVPSQPSIEQSTIMPENKGKQARLAPLEVDVLMSLMEPYDNAGMDMDRPKMFASLHYPPMGENVNQDPQRKDLLGDVEEIRYSNARAWGANVGLNEKGLYQFILEARPRWDEERGKYYEEYAKVILPVLGVENGWNLPAGMALEIIPLSRPFGITAPALFMGKALYGGKPLADAPVYMGRINDNKLPAPTEWHKTMEVRTDANGQFAFTLNQPGWWYCAATVGADPLRGPDGEPRAVERVAVLWLYVDSQPPAKK